MKKICFLLILLFAARANATNYFLSATGSDANNGLSSGSPWLSPNHALNCGDVITAAASTAYSSTNFYNNKWGTVTCPGNNNVAWLKCATFDGCKITVNNSYGMWVSKSYWGVQGWEVHATGTFAGCFEIAPINSGASTIHHIIIANDIANGCTASGISSTSEGAVGVDYLAVIGSITYNSASASDQCYSGLNFGTPVASDTVAGTHYYIAGNFAWDNLNPNPCAGTTPTDGEGVIFDTFNAHAYTQQAVATNNLLFLNGGRGMQTNQSAAPTYFTFNTTYGNNNDPNQSQTLCAEIVFNNSIPAQAYNNLSMTSAATSCTAHTMYGFYVASGNGSDVVRDTTIYSAAGNNTQIASSPGFSYGPNIHTGVNPTFPSVADPGAPSCGSSSSVPNCMATTIANFTPGAGGMSAFGRQPVSNISVNDPLFPQWLCTANIPVGLVTPGCGVVPNGSGTGGVIIQ